MHGKSEEKNNSKRNLKIYQVFPHWKKLKFESSFKSYVIDCSTSELKAFQRIFLNI